MVLSRGKWTKHKIVAGSPGLASSLPDTRPMGEKSFWTLLNKYGSVIVKPSTGSGGSGVIQAASCGDEKYEVHYGNNKVTLNGRQEAYSFVHGKTKGRSHIVQQKIPLAKVNGRPFDIRVMVQRSGASDWIVTGKLAKVAGTGYIITNIARSKGRVMPLSTALRNANLRGRLADKHIQDEIDRISLQAVKRLHASYRWIKTVGLDIGVDNSGKVWIIEANFTPMREMFLRLKDKTAYRRIKSYYQKHA